VSLTAKDVAEILKLLEGSSFDSLDLEIDGMRVQLRRGGVAGPGNGQLAVRAPSTAPVTPPGPDARAAVTMAAPVEVPPGASAVTAPLLGIFYRAPKPGEPPYVEIGSRVEPGTIVGIIEVMKLMNTVRAGVAGEVVAIPARNGELVEYGEALLFVRGG
jgi:acetyl-CoA carboxylase biotin carboxyl carrier protein